MQTLAYEPGERRRDLDRSAVMRLVVVGAVGWALAALFIRYANGAGLFRGATEAGIFALCFPIAWGTALLLRVGGRLQRDQLVVAMSIVLMTALFLDGGRLDHGTLDLRHHARRSAARSGLAVIRSWRVSCRRFFGSATALKPMSFCA